MFDKFFKSKKEMETLNLEFKKVVAENNAIYDKLIIALDCYNDMLVNIINNTNTQN